MTSICVRIMDPVACGLHMATCMEAGMLTQACLAACSDAPEVAQWKHVCACLAGNSLSIDPAPHPLCKPPACCINIGQSCNHCTNWLAAGCHLQSDLWSASTGNHYADAARVTCSHLLAVTGEDQLQIDLLAHMQYTWGCIAGTISPRPLLVTHYIGISGPANVKMWLRLHPLQCSDCIAADI